MKANELLSTVPAQVSVPLTALCEITEGQGPSVLVNTSEEEQGNALLSIHGCVILHQGFNYKS